MGWSGLSSGSRHLDVVAAPVVASGTKRERAMGRGKKKHESSGGDKKKTRATVGFEWTDLAWLGLALGFY